MSDCTIVTKFVCRPAERSEIDSDHALESLQMLLGTQAIETIPWGDEGALLFLNPQGRGENLELPGAKIHGNVIVARFSHEGELQSLTDSEVDRAIASIQEFSL